MAVRSSSSGWISLNESGRPGGASNVSTRHPKNFSQLLALCTAFADPVLTHTAQHLTWDPDRRAWSG